MVFAASTTVVYRRLASRVSRRSFAVARSPKGTPESAAAAATTGANNTGFFNRLKADIGREEVIEISREIKMKNAVMATGLLMFVIGVMAYSARAVGQAGGGAEDPLAALQNEASAAFEQREIEKRRSEEAEKSLKQFEEGELDPEGDDFIALKDPDIYSGGGKKKRPWYKFW
jgi:hypothetical protein